MWISGFFSDPHGNASSSRLINTLAFLVASYVMLKAANNIPPSSPGEMATLLGVYVGVFTIPGAVGKFAERAAPKNSTITGDVNDVSTTDKSD